MGRGGMRLRWAGRLGGGSEYSFFLSFFYFLFCFCFMGVVDLLDIKKKRNKYLGCKLTIWT